MGKSIESLDPAIQKEIEAIQYNYHNYHEYRQLLDNQQKLIDSLGIPDETTSASSLNTLQDIQFV